MRFPSPARATTAGLLLLAWLAAGCVGTRPAVDPDRQYGHRYEEESPDDRETLLLSPPDSTIAYLTYPADVFNEVIIRPAAFDPARPAGDQTVAVEVLVKGALPDACTELHHLEQQRSGHIIAVELLMRRPDGRVCISVVRPYRFYFPLEGLYGPGSYTLKLNGQILSFEVKAPVTANR